MSNPVNVQTPDGPMPAHLWLPESGSGPGLLLLQEIFGVSNYIQRRAADLAAAGYVVLAPELYWRLEDAQVDEGAADVLDQAMALVSQLDWPTTVADAAAALVHLRGLDEVQDGAGVIGFCFGGGLGFALAAVEEPDVLVSFYGSSIPGLLDLAPLVTCPSLHHFGLADSYIDADTVAAMEQSLSAGGDVRFETYPGADHAFDNSDFPLHDPDASALAWSRTLDFLADELPAPDPM